MLPRRPFEELPPAAQRYVRERERSIEMQRQSAALDAAEIRAQAALVARLWSALTPEEIDAVLAHHGWPARENTRREQ